MSLPGLLSDTAPTPPKIIVYGDAGAGKTTLAGQAGAIVVTCENGAGNVPGLVRTPVLHTWPEIQAWLSKLADSNDENIQAVAVDTIDWAVKRIIEHVIVDMDTSGKKADALLNTIGSAHGGYYKARDIVGNIINRQLIPLLDRINEKGRVVLLLAHAGNQKWTTPEGYDMQYCCPKLPEFVGSDLMEWADAVLYLKNEGTADAMTRRCYTTHTNTIKAKNRYRMPPALQLPHDQNTFRDAEGNTSWDIIAGWIQAGMFTPAEPAKAS